MSQPEFRRLVNILKDRKFKAKVRGFMERSLNQLAKDREGLTFLTSPAGKFHHHSYAGGLLQHTLSTTKIAMMLADVLEKSYGWKRVNRDYVVAGSLLHDLFKPLTYRVRDDGTYDYSPLGEKLDHLTILIGEAYREGFPEDFIHVLAAGHGDAGPISPRTVEALIVHLADLVDSRLVGDIQKAAYYITRSCRGEGIPVLTPKEALGIIYAKQTGGCRKVEEFIGKMRRR